MCLVTRNMGLGAGFLAHGLELGRGHLKTRSVKALRVVQRLGPAVPRVKLPLVLGLHAGTHCGGRGFLSKGRGGSPRQLRCSDVGLT